MSSPSHCYNAHAIFKHHPRTHLSPTYEIYSRTPTSTGASAHPTTDRTQICAHGSRNPPIYQRQHNHHHHTPIHRTSRIHFTTTVHTSTLCTHRSTARTTHTAQGKGIYCQQCHTFNYASHHAARLERAIFIRPYLRRSLATFMFQPRLETQHIHQTTINNTIMQHPTQPLTTVIHILHIIHSPAQLDTTHLFPLTTYSSPTITSLRFLACTMSIPTTHDTFTHPQPSTSHYHVAYANAATI